MIYTYLFITLIARNAKNKKFAFFGKKSWLPINIRNLNIFGKNRRGLQGEGEIAM